MSLLSHSVTNPSPSPPPCLQTLSATNYSSGQKTHYFLIQNYNSKSLCRGMQKKNNTFQKSLWWFRRIVKNEVGGLFLKTGSRVFQGRPHREQNTQRLGHMNILAGTVPASKSKNKQKRTNNLLPYELKHMKTSFF